MFQCVSYMGCFHLCPYNSAIFERLRVSYFCFQGSNEKVTVFSVPVCVTGQFFIQIINFVNFFFCVIFAIFPFCTIDSIYSLFEQTTKKQSIEKSIETKNNKSLFDQIRVAARAVFVGPGADFFVEKQTLRNSSKPELFSVRLGP